MFISWRTYRAQTGIVETDMAFWCARCGAQCPMQIRTQGFGSSVALYGAVGGSADAARNSAVGDARARAQNAARFVRCPGCGGVPRELEAHYAALIERITRRAKRALPIAAVIGGLATVVLGGAGLLDIGVSSAALVAGLASGVALFGMSLFLLSQTEPVVQPAPAEVWLQWGDWIPGQLAIPPRPPSTAGKKAAGAIATVFGGLTAFIALIVWAGTFGDVYVVDSDGRATLEVQLDGATVRATPMSGKDTHAFKVGVRKKGSHALVVPGEEKPFELTGTPSSWLVVTGKKASSVCMYEREAVYASYDAKTAEPAVIWRGGVGVAPLTRSYQHMFEPPPRSVTVKQGQTERRWVLRTIPCAEADEPSDADPE